MSLRTHATSGIVWTFFEQFGNQLISFFVSLILARLLLPEEFGLIGMIGIFVAVGRTLVDGGLTQSLIRSKDLSDIDFSTVFYFNLVASFVIYGIIYFFAPYIGRFYEQPVLTELVRVYCFTFVISAFGAVQIARLTKNMNFKTQTLISIPATLVGGIIGIWMAYTGFGVWSLVWSIIITSLLSSLLLWYYSGWKPQLSFSLKIFKEHFYFGYKLTLSGLLDTIFKNIYLLLIGKYFSAAQLGFYTRAETMKQLPVTNISNVLNKVTYPLFASIQQDDLRLKRVYAQLMKMVTFIIAPILIFLAILGEPTFRLLFTEKWLPAVPYFQILCLTGILYPLHAYNLNILKVKGRSDLFLKLEVYKKIIMIVTIIATLPFGIIALLYGQIFISVIAFIINTYYTGKFIDYSTWDQAKDILPIMSLAMAAGTIIFLFDNYFLFSFPDLVRILGGGLIGTIFYLATSALLNFKSFSDIKNLILNK